MSSARQRRIRLFEIALNLLLSMHNWLYHKRCGLNLNLTVAEENLRCVIKQIVICQIVEENSDYVLLQLLHLYVSLRIFQCFCLK